MTTVIVASLVIGGLAGGIGLLLAAAAARLPPDRNRLVTRVDELLPQTQCGQCGYPGCRPYAEAIAAGEAPINRCAPGGELLIRSLAELLGRPAEPLDPAFGEHRGELLAVIDETRCIGCRRCLEVCPVDAILGAHRHVHTVLVALCTGCELCLPPCPVDCIELRPRTDDA